MRRVLPLVLVLLAAVLAAPALAADAPADQLRAGVGRADLTSPTGYYMQGWVRSDAVLKGVHTRIEARAVVLQRGGQKLALVAVGLNGVSGGVVADAAKLLAGRGFDEKNIIVSASHTHAAPSGYFTFDTYNTVFMSTSTPTQQNIAGQRDPQLYAFEVRRLAQAIAAADDDLGPAKLGWGSVHLRGVTSNRSLEAHLRDHGIIKVYGTGKISDDPGGYEHTIDSEVQVLRVDKLLGGSYRPVGGWSTFADHGTTNQYTYGVYNDDHHGAATRVFESEVRRRGGTPAGQDVVNAYGNTDEGDQSAGLVHHGPAWAEQVGREEARAMLDAWTDAGTRMTASPDLDVRWTRQCFCGRDTADGPVSKTGQSGLPLFTGSEEGRGPLYDVTHVAFEGRANPTNDPIDPAQGHKIVITRMGGVPEAVPLTVARIGERLVATIPGEMTVEMGRRVRAAVKAAAGAGVTGVQLSGLANEYLSYFTTPEEYDAQHYEGGSTMYGRTASVLLQDELVKLTGELTAGRAATPAFPYDPRNGVTDAGAAPFGTGAATATALVQPATTQRLARAQFAWQGGTRGLDLPPLSPFVSVERRTGPDWTPVADDLGLTIKWVVNDNGRYDAEWEVPRATLIGEHRFVATGNNYRLVSAPFTVVPATTLSVERAPAGSVVRYPDAVTEVDITYRPAIADGAAAPAGAVPAGAVRDAYGNCNGAPVGTAGRTGADPSADPAVCGVPTAAEAPVDLPVAPPVHTHSASTLPHGDGSTLAEQAARTSTARTLPATGPASPWLPVGGALLVLLVAMAQLRSRHRVPRG